MAGVVTALADDYAYLTFETTDGGKTSVSISSLTLTIDGTTLTAGTQQFTLANLSKMYFSATDETTGISETLNVKNEKFTAVYDLQGKTVSKDEMRNGQVYIVKTESGTHKIAVK